MNRPLSGFMWCASIAFCIGGAGLAAAEEGTGAYYVAPALTLATSDRAGAHDVAVGASLAVGTTLVPHLGVELVGDYLRDTHLAHRSVLGVGVNAYLDAAHQGIYLRADAQGGSQSVYNVGLGFDRPLFDGAVSLRLQALWHKYGDDDGQAMLRLGISVPFGPARASVPAADEPVAVVPLAEEASATDYASESVVTDEAFAAAGESVEGGAGEASAPSDASEPASSGDGYGTPSPAAEEISSEAEVAAAPVVKATSRSEAPEHVAAHADHEVQESVSAIEDHAEYFELAEVAPDSESASEAGWSEEVAVESEAEFAAPVPDREPGVVPAPASADLGEAPTEPAPLPRGRRAATTVAASAPQVLATDEAPTEAAPAPRGAARVAVTETVASGTAAQPVLDSDEAPTEPAPKPRR
ncbi:MAG: hypothetical protein ACPHN2_13925 [Sinimarinibacterium flocculans]|uniref:hypothetical protein n=1 Tax=Sinimarinibacterium flocculans TaxID=985250 RepID=UPI003C64DD02